MKNDGAQTGGIKSTTRDGTKPTSQQPPIEGETSPAVRGGAPVDGMAGTTKHTDTIYKSGGKAPIGSGLTSSMGTWPIRSKGKTDDRI